MARMATVMRTDGAAAAREALARAEAAYREAWEAERRASAEQKVRDSIPGLEHQVEGLRKEVAGHEARLAELARRRDGYAGELLRLPEDTSRLPGQEADRVRRRQDDLRMAIGAIEGYRSCLGTLADDLHTAWPRSIPRAERAIAEARERLEKTEAELEGARRQLEESGHVV